MVRFSKQFAVASLKDTVKILPASSSEVRRATQRNGYSRCLCRLRAQWNTVLHLWSWHESQQNKVQAYDPFTADLHASIPITITIYLLENEADQLDRDRLV